MDRRFLESVDIGNQVKDPLGNDKEVYGPLGARGFSRDHRDALDFVEPSRIFELEGRHVEVSSNDPRARKAL